MKVACVLFGQPRDYMMGYNNLMKFFKDQSGVEVEYFYHCWTLNNNGLFSSSPWRQDINIKTLIYNKDTEERIKSLYNPVSYEYQNQSSLSFDITPLKRTVPFINTFPAQIHNIDNTLYQLYSRNKARNLLDNYIKETNKEYDYVVFTRFDINNIPVLDLCKIDKSIMYVQDAEHHHGYFKDYVFFIPTNVFLKIFDLFDNLKSVIEDPELIYKMKSISQHIEINPESLIFARYHLEFDNLDKVKYIDIV
jgi:hypothetical protein